MRTELEQLRAPPVLQFHQSSRAAVPLPALAAQEAAQRAVAAEVGVQPTVAEPAVELAAERYRKCWESSRLGQSLDLYCVAVQSFPDIFL
jgi:hypothetical protein